MNRGLSLEMIKLSMQLEETKKTRLSCIAKLKTYWLVKALP